MKYLSQKGDLTIEVIVVETDTVDDIKAKIQSQESISTYSKYLMFKGKKLESRRFLVSYFNIDDKSMLYLEG